MFCLSLFSEPSIVLNPSLPVAFEAAEKGTLLWNIPIESMLSVKQERKWGQLSFCHQGYYMKTKRTLPFSLSSCSLGSSIGKKNSRVASLQSPCPHLQPDHAGAAGGGGSGVQALLHLGGSAGGRHPAHLRRRPHRTLLLPVVQLGAAAGGRRGGGPERVPGRRCAEGGEEGRQAQVRLLQKEGGHG